MCHAAGGDDRIVLNAKLRSDTSQAGRLAQPSQQPALGADREMPAYQAPFQLIGTIADRQGTPIAGASVTVDAASATQGGPGLEPTQTATTDEKGHFTLSFNGSARSYSVKVRAVNFIPMTTTIMHYRGPTVTYAAHLSRGTIQLGATSPLTSFPRAQLGSADAADFWIGGGDIIVQGTNSDSVTFELVQRPAVHRGDSAAAAFMRQDEYGTHPVTGYGIRAPGGPGTQLVVLVPRNLKELTLTVGHYGDIRVHHFDGELSIVNERGLVELADITGPTLVEARNGNVQAVLGKLAGSGTAGLDILGRNGDISITLPADMTANMQLTAHGGTITSDFEQSGGKTGARVYLDGAPPSVSARKARSWRTAEVPSFDLPPSTATWWSRRRAQVRTNSDLAPAM